MLDKLLTFQFGGYYGGSFGELFAYMEQAGFFSYALPFLLIFALVFGILTRTKIFKDNKPVNAIISLVVGLLALQFNFVPLFFSEIFPRLGIGLAIILALLILVGLFAPAKQDAWTHWLFFGAGFVVFIIVLIKTFGWLGWGGSFSLWYYNWPQIVMVALIIIGIVIVWAHKSKEPKKIDLKFPGPPQWQTGD